MSVKSVECDSFVGSPAIKRREASAYHKDSGGLQTALGQLVSHYKLG